jgi:hypothetical protein
VALGLKGGRCSKPFKTPQQKVAKEPECHSREGGPCQAAREIHSFQVVKKGMDLLLQGGDDFLQ